MRKKKTTVYDNALLEVKKFSQNAKLMSDRDHELHIRITSISNSDAINFLNLFKNTYDGSDQDKRYSTSYRTHFITINGIYTPIVLGCGEYKVNSKDSITQKQLTPKKLNIIGDFNNLKDFIDVVKQAIKRNPPELNSYWNSNNKEEFADLLIKLVDSVLNKNGISFNSRESEILKEHGKSLSKDFGEILAAVEIIRKEGNVSLEESESSANFDLSCLVHGVRKKFNNKSGSGSGQSFKSIRKELSIVDSSDYVANSGAAVALNIMKNLCDSKAKGNKKVWEMCNEAFNLPEDFLLKKILNDFSKVFFNNANISLDNYVPATTFKEFSNKVEEILNEHGVNIIGIPKGSHEENPEKFYSTLLGKENAILFCLATIICTYFDEDVVTAVMNNLLKTKVYLIHTEINSNGVFFKEPTMLKYKFHYWGSYKSITNNLPGFKTLY